MNQTSYTILNAIFSLFAVIKIATLALESSQISKFECLLWNLSKKKELIGVLREYSTKQEFILPNKLCTLLGQILS